MTKIKIPIILFSLAVIVIVSGCTSSFNPEVLAKTSPLVQDFLSDYPNADIRITHFTATQAGEIIEEIRADCGNPQVEPKEFYRVKIDDTLTNLFVVVWIDAETQTVECALKRGVGPVCGNGICESNETSANCPQDCSVINETHLGCLNQACVSVPGAGADLCFTDTDCQNQTVYCGDGTCNGNETSITCPQDCGNQTGQSSCEDETCTIYDGDTVYPVIEEETHEITNVGVASFSTAVINVDGFVRTVAQGNTYSIQGLRIFVDAVFYYGPEDESNSIVIQISSETESSCEDGTCTIYDGDTVYPEVNETTYTITNNGVANSSTAVITVNNVTQTVTQWQTYEFGDLRIIIKEVLYFGAYEGAGNYIKIQVSSVLGEYCGDGTCNGNETSITCPQDCPVINETHLGCLNQACVSVPGAGADLCFTDTDCQNQTVYCGDGTCNGNETSITCPQDCGNQTDTTPPELTVTVNPVNGSQAVTFTINASASDASGIDYIDILLDNSTVKTCNGGGITALGCIHSAMNVSIGQHTVLARAFDMFANTVSDSAIFYVF